MGRALFDQFESAAAVYELAERATGLPIRRLCFEGPEDQLVLTQFLQPCLAATSLAALAAALEKGGLQDPDAPVSLANAANPPFALAGHSVGELAALAAAGALDIETAFRIVAERARAMGAAGQARPGGMLALIGGDVSGAQSLCREIAGDERGFRIGIANLNAPGQTIVAGDEAAIDRVSGIARAHGFRRAVALPVSAAFHTPLMEPARARLAAELAELPVHDPGIPVVSNVTGEFLPDAEAVREEIGAQVTAPVQWIRSMRFLAGRGITSFFEVGPGNVLSGLLRRTIPSARGTPVGEPEQLDSLAETLRGTANG